MRLNDIAPDMLPLREGLALEGRAAEDVDEAWLRQCISDRGIAFVHSIHTPAVARAVAASIGDVRAHRDANEDGVTVVAPRAVEAGRTGLQGFGYQPLFPHTDRTIAALPPDLVFIWCEEASATGGVSLLVDASDVYRELCESSPEIAEQLRQPDAAVFESDGAFMSVLRVRVAIRTRVRTLPLRQTALHQLRLQRGDPDTQGHDLG
jgi:alpha-ketoglutarate-dependent taurine dioxygenase